VAILLLVEDIEGVSPAPPSVPSKITLTARQVVKNSDVLERQKMGRVTTIRDLAPPHSLRHSECPPTNKSQYIRGLHATEHTGGAYCRALTFCFLKGASIDSRCIEGDRRSQHIHFLQTSKSILKSVQWT
jgi:hypothetical protein